MTKTSNLDSFLENVHEDDKKKLRESIDKTFADVGKMGIIPFLNKK